MKDRIFLSASIVVLMMGAAIFTLGKSDALMGHFQHRSDRQKHSFGPEMVDHIARELNLTEAQKTQVKTLLESAHATMASLHQKMDDAHKQLEAATANGQFDEAQVRSLAAQQAQGMVETIVEHERMKSKIYSLLTPEQRIKADEMLKRHRHHKSGMH
jgi:periplasmic protein CpxP/Spy